MARRKWVIWIILSLARINQQAHCILYDLVLHSASVELDFWRGKKQDGSDGRNGLSLILSLLMMQRWCRQMNVVRWCLRRNIKKCEIGQCCCGKKKKNNNNKRLEMKYKYSARARFQIFQTVKKQSLLGLLVILPVVSKSYQHVTCIIRIVIYLQQCTPDLTLLLRFRNLRTCLFCLFI